MNNDILEIPVVAGNGDSIFSSGHYIVPIYQRAFSWGTGDNVRHNEIIQLMDDVYESNADFYRLGSLIVAYRADKKYEVIDGQQRLTALFLILSRLGIHIEKEGLSYACRPSAEAILRGIAKDTGYIGDGVSENDPASGIVAGLRAIDKKIESQDNPVTYKQTLLEKFKRTLLCRIVVPENTDLNRYFEIMNTRGEQLEPQDIVKANLMSRLADDAERVAFATVWDACSDIDGYCQMHIHDLQQRDKVFCNNWSELNPYDNGVDLLTILSNANRPDDKEGEARLSFQSLISSEQGKIPEDILDDQYSRFESIIDFRHFLLHSLKVFMGDNGEWSLNDMTLIETFEKAVKQYGLVSKKTAADFSREFILHLLKCRYLFDRYVIKRVYDANGRSEWCLNELIGNSEGGPSYRQTWQDNSPGNEKVLMLESCMRVSYLDPKRMHWLTRLLNHLVKSKYVSAEGVIGVLEDIGKAEIKKFLGINNYACMGVATPHVVFNYLDYLLWERQGEVDEIFNTNGFAKGFAFEYRSSVEHWYPRNPPDGKSWFEDVHRFGNLCILRGDINSKFSNLLPKSKQLNREQYIRLEHQSLKLRIMAKITERGEWDKDSCKTHEEMMLRVLRGEPLDEKREAG